MELIDGVPIEGPVPPDQGLDYASKSPTLSKPRTASSIGDLKPANSDTPAGVIKVLDFASRKMRTAPASDPDKLADDDDLAYSRRHDPGTGRIWLRNKARCRGVRIGIRANLSGYTRHRQQNRVIQVRSAAEMLDTFGCNRAERSTASCGAFQRIFISPKSSSRQVCTRIIITDKDTWDRINYPKLTKISGW